METSIPRISGDHGFSELDGRIVVFKRKAVLPPRIEALVQRNSIGSFLKLITADVIDWLEPMSFDVNYLPGAFMSYERLVFAISLCKIGELAESSTDPANEFEPFPNTRINVSAPVGHGKTHFVQVVAAALATSFPNVGVAYISARSDDTFTADSVVMAAIAKTMPDVINGTPDKVDWKGLLEKRNRFMILFVDECHNWLLHTTKPSNSGSLLYSLIHEIRPYRLAVVTLGSYSFAPRILCRNHNLK